MPVSDCLKIRKKEIPHWVPISASNYLEHTEAGLSLNAIAEHAGCHASTVLRRVRSMESRRDDTLIDQALTRIGTKIFDRPSAENSDRKDPPINASPGPLKSIPSDDDVNREARRILRRLAEPGACLAIASEMEKAVVVREDPSGESLRTAIVDRPVAEAMALKQWISCETPGRISHYRITIAGRSALKNLIAENENKSSSFGGRDLDEKFVATGQGTRRKVKYNRNESPLLALARRKDKDGKPFLSAQMVAAGERLRGDFELAHLGPRTTQNWEKFLTGSDGGKHGGGGASGKGSGAARDRVHTALKDLGPGLGDMVLRCCCFLEGLEAAEKRMGWSARSGKIVLRIALQRLCHHYDTREDGWDPLIG